MIQPQYLQQQYPQAPSAVSINIYEPKSYGSNPQPQAMAPYDYTSQLYAMPQASAWGQQTQTAVQSPFQQYIPTMPQYTPQAAPVEQQAMPQSTIEQAPQEAQTPQEAQAPQEAPAATQAQAPMPQVEQGEQAPKVDTNALLADLKSQDYNTQAEAITSIANFTQATPDIALQVATDPVKQGLIDIINTDTSALEETTPEQKALADKQAKGEKLTPEEQAQLDQLSPKVAANKNKVFALFTLAMVQKLSRDNEAQYAQFQTEQGKTPAAPLALKDLMGYNEIVNTIQNEPNKELKIAAIQALQYVAKPEEKAEVEQVLQTSLNSEDPAVKQTAQEALAKLGETTAAPAEQAPAEQAPAEQTPVEEAPAEQAPAEQAPVEEAKK